MRYEDYEDYKKILAIIFAICISMSLTRVFAVDNNMKARVTIPSYKVIFNGIAYSSMDNEYPIISYKNITYIPMTWNLTNFLGLKTKFITSPQTVFYIGNRHTYIDTLEHYSLESDNKSELFADIANYDIYVGILYDYISGPDNMSEEFPILNFRGITYFPLTWHYVKEMFDWEYTFDDKIGFIVNTREAVRPEQNR